MTLLEVVVALAVGGMAITAGVAAFQIVLHVHDDNSRFASEMVRCAALRTALANWVRGAVSNEGDDDRFRGLMQDSRGGAADELTLLTSSETPLGNRGVELHLAVAARDAGHAGGLIADFRSDFDGRMQRVELDTTVRTLRIAYLSSRDSANRWTPGWITSSTLPRAIKITLGTDRRDDAGALLQLPIVIPLDHAP
jgi:hypothetical protein